MINMSIPAIINSKFRLADMNNWMSICSARRGSEHIHVANKSAINWNWSNSERTFSMREEICSRIRRKVTTYDIYLARISDDIIAQIVMRIEHQIISLSILSNKVILDLTSCRT